LAGCGVGVVSGGGGSVPSWGFFSSELSNISLEVSIISSEVSIISSEFHPGRSLYVSRPVIEIQTAENFRLLFGFDNSHSCALLLADPASFSPDSGRLVGEPRT